MEDFITEEDPVLEGGQGRSGADLEAEASALLRYGLAVLVILVLVGVFV